MGRRRARLIDCNPQWVDWDGRESAIYFTCPEGHEDCKRIIPFTPALDGSPQPVKQSNGAHWQRTGDTFETLTLAPSVRAIPQYVNRAAAIAAGVREEHICDSMFCALHIFIKNGAIEFCEDSR